MAKSVNIEEIRVKVEGVAKLGKLSSSFGKLNKNIALTPVQLTKAIKSITSYDKRGQRSVNTFNQQIAALKQLKNNVGIGSDAYKRLGKEIDKLSAKYDVLMGKQKTSGGFFKQLGAGARAGGKNALGASIARFLPAGAQFGAAAGYATTGTMVGGIAGAGIGLGVDASVALARYTKEAAEFSAQIQKLEIALEAIVGDSASFQDSLQFISDTALNLNIPIDTTTKQFTQLAASVLGAGGSLEDAKTVFLGVASSIKATGGSADDVQSAIRAMTQIFGKGKVSAEELQGQLGERLAGAVVKFAEANGSSLQELQKDLRDGTVSLDQVIKFAEKLNLDFGQIALDIANSSADAGQRLKVINSLFKREIGDAVQPIGAAFQKAFADITKGILDSEGAMTFITGTFKVLGTFIFATVEGVRFLIRSLVDMGKILYHIANFQFKEAFKVIQEGFKDTFEQAKLNFSTIKGFYVPPDAGEGTPGDGSTNQSKLPKLTGDGDNSPLKQFAKSAFDIAKQTEEAFVNAFKGIEDALVKFVRTGKLNFRDLANSIIADLTRMFVRYAIVRPLFNAMTGGKFAADLGIKNAKGNVFDKGNIVPSAMGNVFAKNKIVPYAYGGIVKKPTLFPMANGGIGLMGEAGAEAIMPLKRGRDGKLGVASQGGGVGNISVNVNASGSSVEGDSNQAAQLGKMLGMAVQAELIKQKRPGGLLS